MGALNVKAAYAAYAGKVPSTAMVVLVYMALVSKDSDAEPWFGQGHEALAEHALGRVPPFELKDIRAVERAIKSLVDVGAIVVDRRSAPRSGAPRTVRYRLMLPRAVTQRNVVGDAGGDAERAPGAEEDATRNPLGDHPTETVRDTTRKTFNHHTKNVQTPNENRVPEEEEETGGDTRISQSARVREAVRWLRDEYGLTDREAATVWAIAEDRAAEPVRNPLRYLQSMRQDPQTGDPKADLADIVGAVWDAAKPEAPTF
ncbi:hypothetical protein ACFQ07_02610, partial [Actinomadura adrarensis]